jgi:hypothetical protein
MEDRRLQSLNIADGIYVWNCNIMYSNVGVVGECEIKCDNKMESIGVSK